jgi:hypothetical protein
MRSSSYAGKFSRMIMSTSLPICGAMISLKQPSQRVSSPCIQTDPLPNHPIPKTQILSPHHARQSPHPVVAARDCGALASSRSCQKPALWKTLSSPPARRQIANSYKPDKIKPKIRCPLYPAPQSIIKEEKKMTALRAAKGFFMSRNSFVCRILPVTPLLSIFCRLIFPKSFIPEIKVLPG